MSEKVSCQICGAVLEPKARHCSDCGCSRDFAVNPRVNDVTPLMSDGCVDCCCDCNREIHKDNKGNLYIKRHPINHCLPCDCV